jgi:hypothetical protein
LLNNRFFGSFLQLENPYAAIPIAAMARLLVGLKSRAANRIEKIVLPSIPTAKSHGYV